MRSRYPFKEDLANSPEKWTTAHEVVQYLRELAVLEVIYHDLDVDEVSKDLEDVLSVYMGHVEEGDSKFPSIIF